MSLFLQKLNQANFILYFAFSIAITPAVADTRSSTQNHHKKPIQYKSNNEIVVQENMKWRDAVKHNKPEAYLRDSDNRNTEHGYNESSHKHEDQHKRGNSQTWKQYVHSERKTDEASATEPRDQEKPQRRNSEKRERKDKSNSPHDTNRHADHHHDRQSNHTYQDKREHEYESGHRPDRVIVKHNSNHTPGHRPHYNLYNRHKHIYYRTPWYNTRYIAPIHYHFHPVGYHVSVLPTTHIRIMVGGFPYFYFSGVFYKSYNDGFIVVSAPVGAIVPILPVGFIAFSIGTSTFYFVNDIYYAWDEPRQAYVVVDKPAGAEKAIAEATAGRLFVYPKEGQSEEQQAKDRYECHRWAVTESRIDPTLEEETYSKEQQRDYQRAIAACLEGRGYTVK
ncbi:DUF6515 family protein [Kaarinaea lacus]